MILSHTARTLIKLSFIIVPALVGTITLAATSHAAETAPVAAPVAAPAGAKCAVAKRTIIEADGTIRIVTRTVCVAK